MEHNASQRFSSRQNTLFKDPAEGKLVASSQSSFPSDVKMLCFSSKKNERDSKITSIAEDHDLQNQMHSQHSKILR